MLNRTVQKKPSFGERGFTLIELLIVIGILGILVVTLILNIDPAEPQRQSRDINRQRDITKLQLLIENYINAGNPIPTQWSSAGGVTSQGIEGDTSQPCDDNWLGVDMCTFTKNVPLDPTNGSTRSCAGSATTCEMYYRLRFEGADYELGVRQESKSNENKAQNDGGNEDDWYEVFTNENNLF